MDNALRRYYIALGKGDEYKAEDDSTMGQFEYYCQDNGLDLNDEFDAGAQEAMIVDFDDNFPFPKGQEPAQDEAKKEWIFKLLNKIRAHPNMKFHYVNKELPKRFVIVFVLYSI